MSNQLPIPRKAKHPKRGTSFIHQDHGNVWLYHVKSEIEYIVSTDHTFNDPNALHEVKPSDMQALYPKRVSSIISKPKRLTSQEKQQKEDLNDFFASLKVPYTCENCGRKLIAFNSFGKRSVSCHILPKSKFESIATNTDNILFMGAGFLGGCACHDDWDNTGILNRTQMNVYKLALERFEKFKHLLDQAELIQAYTYLNISWQ